MPLEHPLRIAMWSGPRNISTALLRSFESRGDCAVSDEPFYAHYLKATGLPHAGAEEVIRLGETDWRKVAEAITGPVPGGKPIWFQKHMSHHFLPGMGEEWLSGLTHAFLLRDPREMLLSLDAKYPSPKLEDTGLPQQVRIFQLIRRRTGRTPPVVDAKDLLLDPRRVLGLLCEALGIEFSERMLSWPPGRRPTDGVWAKHWYGSVEKSTGFEPYRKREGELSPQLEELHRLCRPLYAELLPHRLGG